MKRLTLDEWEKKYIVGQVEGYDQKYQMFLRPFWDMELNKRLDDWSFIGEIKDKPGFTLWDQALRFASFGGAMISLFNMFKPNPMPETKAIMETIAATGPGDPSMSYRPPEGTKIDTSDPARITYNLKKVATYFGADLVGICKLDRRWMYSHTFAEVGGILTGKFEKPPDSKPQEIPEEFQYAIVMALGEDYHLFKYFPTYPFIAETYRGYSHMAFISLLFSRFIRNLGFNVIDSSINDVAMFIPMAMQAGLGEIGRNGLLITPQFGPRVKLNVVMTDLPLVPDSPIDFGVTEFCRVCKKCADMCPAQAISHGERTAKPVNASNAAGELKWPINAEVCRMYWSQVQRDCGVCITACPYNKVNSWPHQVARWFTDHVRWADPMYVKMDDWLGYGKPKRADNFWEEWNPNPYGHNDYV